MDVAPNGTDLNPAFDERDAVLIQFTDSDTLPATGEGSGLANCAGGPACGPGYPNFNGNGQVNGSDFFLQFTLSTDVGPAGQRLGRAYNRPC